MKLTILGSGASVIKKNARGSSFALEFSNQTILFDCGWSMAESLLDVQLDIQKIDHIFISHPHADHLGGLLPLLQSMYVEGKFYPERQRKKPLYLHGYEGFEKDYESLRTIMFPERAEEYEIKVIEHKNKDKQTYAGFELISTEVIHNPHLFHANAYRINTPEKSFVYSGDMGYDENFVELSKDVDCMVLEMSFWPAFYREFGPRQNHVSTFECGVIAQKANAKKLVLVHKYDKAGNEEILSEIKKSYGGETIISKDLMEITV